MCTPNIKNDYGILLITNFYNIYYPFMKGIEKELFPIRLFNVKKLEDKINEV